MVFQRCAWHTTYRGYPRYYGFARDGRARITWTNGICTDCAARVRAEWRLTKQGARPPQRSSTTLRLRLATVVLAATLLAAHGLDSVPLAPAEPGALGPPAQAVVAAAPTAATDLPLGLAPSPRTPRGARSRLVAEPVAQGAVASLHAPVQLAHAPRSGRAVTTLVSQPRAFDHTPQMP